MDCSVGLRGGARTVSEPAKRSSASRRARRGLCDSRPHRALRGSGPDADDQVDPKCSRVDGITAVDSEQRQDNVAHVKADAGSYPVAPILQLGAAELIGQIPTN